MTMTNQKNIKSTLIKPTISMIILITVVNIIIIPKAKRLMKAATKKVIIIMYNNNHKGDLIWDNSIDNIRSTDNTDDNSNKNCFKNQKIAMEIM